MINIHTHYKYPKAGFPFIRNLCLGFGNPNLANVPYWVSVGLHPWHIHKMPLIEVSEKLLSIATCKQVIAIGEIGLDKGIPNPMNNQLKVFDAQFTVARALAKPTIIHNVKAQNELLPILKKSSVPFIIHGFNGNKEQAKQWLNAGAYLSLGKAVFQNHFYEVVKYIPIDKLFCETDNWPGSISEVYKMVAAIKSLSTDELDLVINNNFAQVFKLRVE